MVLHVEDSVIHCHELEGQIGLELETYRVKADGTLARTEHPFPGDAHIVKDYSEDQVEINTSPENSPEKSVEQLTGYLKIVQNRLLDTKSGETLWPFSNPPYLRGEEDIRIAQYHGEERKSTIYREYLSERYGRYKMTYSGIHFNYSFAEELIKRNFELDGGSDYREYKNKFYLELAEKTVAYGWALVPLMAASPLIDSSFYEKDRLGDTEFIGFASLRCSELGYWNHFTPVFEYTSINAYADSMERYVRDGILKAARELYYPVRLKPSGKYTLEGLRERGIDHIEFRMVDLNPFAKSGIEVTDVAFIQLFFIWLSAIEIKSLTCGDQIQAVQNFKSSARYDISLAKIAKRDGSSVSVKTALDEVLSDMEKYFDGYSDEVKKILEYQRNKLEKPQERYAYQVRQRFGKDYVKRGLEFAYRRQEEIHV